MSKFKLATLMIVTSIMAMGLVYGYPYAKKYFGEYKVPYYIYTPDREVKSKVDVSVLPPAKAVPILMYHGVTEKDDGENTDQAHFVAQMEMLKTEGYETISLGDLDLFLDGKKVLPPKPIVITFDDGRKDSYYPTDDVFKKLGFKATLFEVSGKANDMDKFYLNWDELKTMRDSGRWDIEAHGTYSHIKIDIDDKGTQGRYLSSRIYDPKKGLETEEEYKKRVIWDYEKNILDLRNRLGIQAKYYAIPLNDYGYHLGSNYPESKEFNHELLRKYFRLAFYQANDSTDVYHIVAGIYNYKDANRWALTRIEVKNMDPEFLKTRLEEELPRNPGLGVGTSNLNEFAKHVRESYGDVQFSDDGMHLATTNEFSSVRAIFGDYHWQNYVTEAFIKRVKGRSVVLLGYVLDDKNYVSFGITDNSVFLRETIKEEERDLIEPVFLNQNTIDTESKLKLEFNGQNVTASLNGRIIFRNIKVDGVRGAVGFKVWDDKHQGEGVLKSLTIGRTLKF